MDTVKKWYESDGAFAGGILSTRVRLARNLDGIPFPCRLSPAGREKISELVRGTLDNVSGLKLRYVDMMNLPQVTAVALAERHLISPEFAVDDKVRGLLISEDESISIMLCEEDHIRIQVIKAGMELDGAYATASELDDLFDASLSYAYDERLGYLTQCPTNLGTGMRASVMLHLPALSKCGQMPKLTSTVSKLGLTVRGTYGEGSSAKGDIYQISNQISLGISERAAIDNLRSVTMQIATQERNAEEEYVKNLNVQDKINRAYGILTTARLLSTDEMLDLFSWMRLGTQAGMLDMDVSKLNELTETMQAATLSAANGGNVPVDRRDELRANAVKKALFGQ